MLSPNQCVSMLFEKFLKRTVVARTGQTSQVAAVGAGLVVCTGMHALLVAHGASWRVSERCAVLLRYMCVLCYAVINMTNVHLQSAEVQNHSMPTV